MQRSAKWDTERACVCVCCCRRRCCCMTKNSHTQENCVTLKEISRFSVERQPKKKVYCIKFGTDSEAVRERNGVKVITITSWYESRVLSIKMVLWRWQLIASQSVIRLLSMKTLIHRCIWMEQLAYEQQKNSFQPDACSNIEPWTTWIQQQIHVKGNRGVANTQLSTTVDRYKFMCPMKIYLVCCGDGGGSSAVCFVCIPYCVMMLNTGTSDSARYCDLYLCTFFSLSPSHSRFCSQEIEYASESQDNIWRFISNYYFSCDFFVVVAIVMRWIFVFISSFEYKKKTHTETKLHVRINWAENNTIWMAQNTWMAPKKVARK